MDPADIVMELVRGPTMLDDIRARGFGGSSLTPACWRSTNG